MSRTLITLACLVVVFAGIRAAASLVVPFLLALFLAILLTPVFLRLKRVGLPTSLAMMIVILGLAVFLFLSMTVLKTSLDEFAAKLPVYEAGLRRQLQVLTGWLESFGIDTAELTKVDLLSPRAIISYAGGLASALSVVLGQGFFIFIVTVFMLIEASGFHLKIRSLDGMSAERFKMLEDNVQGVRNYVSIKSAMSLLTGILVALWLYGLGVDNFLFMGLLAFFLNFVPNIGSIIAAFPGILLALVTYGTGMAFVTALGYLVINIGVSNIIEPRFMGQRLGISPLVILMSLVFWGWLLGPVGMLLSVPLTMFLKVVLESGRQTRSLALLLGPAPVETMPSPQPASTKK